MGLERLFDSGDGDFPPGDLYRRLDFPAPPADRPYVFINMVATADGKALLGPRGSTAKGLGSATDQMLMRRLEEGADGVIVGASTLRTSHIIYPSGIYRAVVTRSGDLALDNRFFTDAPDKAIVFAPESLPEDIRRRLGEHAQVRIAGSKTVEVGAAVRTLRKEFGVQHLLLEGGPSLNFDFFATGVVDEFFLTLAPKVKGGAELPTPVDGPGLPGFEFAPLRLKSLYRDGDELYLRYAVGEMARK
jgi:riboflavin biosynthesis pyrimidine reductase